MFENVHMYVTSRILTSSLFEFKHSLKNCWRSCRMNIPNVNKKYLFLFSWSLTSCTKNNKKIFPNEIHCILRSKKFMFIMCRDSSMTGLMEIEHKFSLFRLCELRLFFVWTAKVSDGGGVLLFSVRSGGSVKKKNARKPI